MGWYTIEAGFSLRLAAALTFRLSFFWRTHPLAIEECEYNSMEITAQELLAPHTTFGIGGNAAFFVSVHTVEGLQEAIRWAKGKSVNIKVLGGGSNVLVPDEGYDGLVIHNCIGGILYDGDGVHVGAGVMFDDLVADTVAKGLWGLENLSAIPGTVGAAPIQNIGAYGTEVSSYITEIHAYHIDTDTEKVFSNEACMFGYRDSFFKTEEGKEYVVVGATFKLRADGGPNITYKDLQHYFEGTVPTQREVRDGVIEIRSNKFPDWKEKGTAGSFFKNPVISKELFATLQETYSNMPGFDTEDGQVKIPLGWILDKVLHLKGVTNDTGTVGSYEKQALVLVNHGGATADDVNTFAKKIIQDVFGITGIRIEREVQNFL